MNHLMEKAARYEVFLKSDPENTTLLISLGDLYHQLGQFEQAKKHINKVLHLDGQHVVAKSRLAAVFMSEGCVDQALNLFLELQNKGESEPVLSLNIAICQFTLYQLDVAKVAFLELAKVKGVDRPARFYLASVLQMENKVAEALELVDELLIEEPEDYLLGYKSTLLYTLGRLDEAFALASQVLRSDESNPDACSTLGTFYAEKLEVEIAEPFFKKMTLRAPGDARGWHGLGIVAMQLGYQSTAIELFEKSAELLPNSAGMWTTLAWSYFNSKNYLAAETSFERVIELNRNNPEGLGGKACALAMQSKLSEANAAADAAIRLNKGSFSAVFAKSLLLALKGKKETAEKVLAGLLEQPIRPGGEKAIESINRYIQKHNPNAVDLAESETKLH